MELVAQCANLTNCRLSFPIGPSDGLSPAGGFTSVLRQITLPHLDTLSLTGEVTGNPTFHIVAMLDVLVLPGLQELHLIGLSFLQFDPNVPHAISDRDILQATDELIARSACDLHYTRIFQQDPVNLMPILTALSATASSFVPLCPNLLHLRIAYCDYSAEVHPILRTLIESRCSLVPPGFARLRTVNLSLLTRMALNSAEFAAAMHPTKVTI
ncbi:hypothetical protein B0H19DRAFT_1256351 [Mycena capillaripes]|nr:hypothetical protein B0H19DRAFT_1256351 [Mycena capillaripes]